MEAAEWAANAAVFVAFYLGIIGTVFAMGAPQSRMEQYIRAVTLLSCAVISIIMLVWIIIGIYRLSGWFD